MKYNFQTRVSQIHDQAESTVQLQILSFEEKHNGRMTGGFIHFYSREIEIVLEFDNTLSFLFKPHLLYIVTTVKLDFGTTFVLSGY